MGGLGRTLTSRCLYSLPPAIDLSLSYFLISPHLNALPVYASRESSSVVSKQAIIQEKRTLRSSTRLVTIRLKAVWTS